MPTKNVLIRRACEKKYRQSAKGKAKRREQMRRRMADPERRAARLAYVDKWLEDRPGYHKKKSAEWRLLNPERQLLNSARYRARKMQMKFDIELQDIVIPTHCPWLGIRLLNGPKADCSPSIDRIDNTLGYIKGNIEVISLRANLLKNAYTLRELAQMGTRAKFLLGEA